MKKLLRHCNYCDEDIQIGEPIFGNNEGEVMHEFCAKEYCTDNWEQMVKRIGFNASLEEEAFYEKER